MPSCLVVNGVPVCCRLCVCVCLQCVALDARGTCCDSGAVDRCGVCDGGDRSCAVEVWLVVQVSVAVAGSPDALVAVREQVRVGVCASVATMLPCARVVVLSLQPRLASTASVVVDIDIVIGLLPSAGCVIVCLRVFARAPAHALATVADTVAR